MNSVLLSRGSHSALSLGNRVTLPWRRLFTPPALDCKNGLEILPIKSTVSVTVLKKRQSFEREGRNNIKFSELVEGEPKGSQVVSFKKDCF